MFELFGDGERTALRGVVASTPFTEPQQVPQQDEQRGRHRVPEEPQRPARYQPQHRRTR